MAQFDLGGLSPAAKAMAAGVKSTAGSAASSTGPTAPAGVGKVSMARWDFDPAQVLALFRMAPVVTSAPLQEKNNGKAS